MITLFHKLIDYRQTVYVYTIITTLLILLSGCSGGPPDNIVINATKNRKDYAAKTQRTAKEYHVYEKEKMDISRADKENGVTEKWFCKISYLYIDKYTGKWRESKKNGVVILKINNDWIVEQTGTTL